MKKLQTSIFIDAPQEKVWNIMLEDATYRQWTKVFSIDSHYKGNWDEGSEIHFLGEEEGDMLENGMFSRIKENRLHEYISIEHVGFIKNGEVDTTSDEVKKWAPAFESYTFTEKGGCTELAIDMDIDSENKEAFEEMWEKGLKKIKKMAESATT